MSGNPSILSRRAILYFWACTFIGVTGLATFFASCGGSVSLKSVNGMGAITVSITDPPSCAFPHGSFQHVFVTIRSVQAHTSATADDNTPGWQELAPQLNSQPVQIDLFSAGSNACLLAMLGSNSSLPAGTYQQIRLLLVPSSGSSGPLPATSACLGQGFNCVVLHDGTIHELELSSQANTGLKIPPGQIVGGPITVSPGQDIDLNIDFNACASIIVQGNGVYRLKPTLTAEQVGTTNTGISGQVLNAATHAPIAGGTTLVALEQQDASGADIIFEQTAADSTGQFNFCPLPTAATFDVVAVAIDGAGKAYNATIAVGVPGGTNLGAINLAAETGTPAGPATFQGLLTATTGTAAASIDASVAALQPISLGGGLIRSVVIPAEGASTTGISLDSATACSPSAPPHTNCAPYTLIEPASNPSVGIFSAGKISFAAPAAGAVPYSIRANAFAPMMGSTTICTQPSIFVTLDSIGNPLQALPNSTTVPKEIDFTGCS